MQMKAMIRKVSQVAIGMTIPVDVLRALSLEPGDYVVWDIEGDEAKVQFFRTIISEVPAERNETAEAASADNAASQSA